MSDSFGTFILLGLVMFYLVRRSYLRKKKYPALDEYLKKNPDANRGAGIACINCGSKSIRSWGVNGRDDRKRLYNCNSCGADLYRTGF